MPDGITWKEHLIQEKEKIKGMNNKQKWSYFKSYYLLKLIIFLVLFLMALSMLKEFISNGREVLISGCMVNTCISDKGYQYLTDDYFVYCNGNERKQVVQLAKDNYIDFKGKNPEMEGNSQQLALFAQITAGDISYLILDKESFNSMNGMDVYADLDQMLSDEMKEKYGDSFAILKAIDTGKEYNAGIDLSKLAISDKLGIEPKEAYLVFIDVKMSEEKVNNFLKYLSNL